MPSGYWLGLATIPFVAGLGALLWYTAHFVSEWLAKLVNRIVPKSRTNQVQTGAVVACSRKSWWFRLPADAVVIVAVGLDRERIDDCHTALARVLTPKPAPPGPRWRRFAAKDNERG